MLNSKESSGLQEQWHSWASTSPAGCAAPLRREQKEETSYFLLQREQKEETAFGFIRAK